MPAGSAEKSTAMPRPSVLAMSSAVLTVSPSPSQTSSLLPSLRESAVAPRPCSAAAVARRRRAWGLPVLRSHVSEVARVVLLLLVQTRNSGVLDFGGAVAEIAAGQVPCVSSTSPEPPLSLTALARLPV